MKATELKIGNWVYSQEIGEKVQISSINDEYVTFKNRVTFDYPIYEEIQPIPLTEEILLKCGYTERQLETGCILIAESGGFIIRQLSDRVVVKHLHQLQNLYFALTGEELEIEL